MLSNQPVKRYWWCWSYQDQRYKWKETPPGQGNLEMVLATDCLMLETRCVELEGACESVIDVVKITQFKRPVSVEMVSDAMIEIVNTVSAQRGSMVLHQDSPPEMGGFFMFS